MCGISPKRVGGTREVPGGIGEEDLVTLVLPYIRSAAGRVCCAPARCWSSTAPTSPTAWLSPTPMRCGGWRPSAATTGSPGGCPTDRVVVMPNQFGLDHFDFADACGEQKENLCSADLQEFVEKYHLALDTGDGFNPRLAFGSHSDADHIYNTPRAWFMARYFLPRTYQWDGENAHFTPESNDIPWSFVPERKVTVEDVRYLLRGSYYQGTPYNPYDKTAACKGKYRTIGVPNSDVCGILQIRGYLPEAVRGVEWLSMGGSGFTACFPVYANVSAFPKYLSGTTDTVSTDSIYWQSRLIAALTDAQFGSSLLLDERYQNAVMNRGQQLLYEYDEKIRQGAPAAILEEGQRQDRRHGERGIRQGPGPDPGECLGTYEDPLSPGRQLIGTV